MTDISLGAARLEIEVDVSQLEVAVRTAKNRLADMSGDAQKQYAQLNTAEKRRVDRLVKQADALGLTKAQQLAYNAALKTSGPVLDELTRKIAQNEARLKAGAIQFNAYGLSAKQTTQALRQVPAQLTDIFTGLAAGQNPMMVLIQQGGQLKDVFGGVAPAARALGGALIGLINPLTIGAAAVGTLGVAYFQAQQEAYAFNKAVILSGNAAGVTIGQLQAEARAIDQVVGTRREAAAVLAQLAGSGKVAAGQLQSAATLALQLEKSAGISAAETAKAFIDLGRRPTEAVKKLNEQYNFLTASTYRQISALEEQGRITDAAAVAQNAFFDGMTKRIPEVEKSLGVLQHIARGWGFIFKETWDAALDVGRQESAEERLREIQKDIIELTGRPRGGRVNTTDSRLRELQAEQLQVQKIVFETQRAAQAKTKAAQDEARAIEDAEMKAEEAKRRREAAQRDTEQSRRSASASSIAAIKRALSSETDAYSQQQDLLEARRAAHLISETEYYAERQRLVGANSDAQQRALSSENARLEQETARVLASAAEARSAADAMVGMGSPQLAKALEEATRRASDAQQIQIQNAERIKENRAEILALDKERASQIGVLTVQETAHGAALTKATDDARISLERYLEVQGRRRARELAGMGAGSRQREFDAGRSEIEDRFEQQRQDIDRDRRNNPEVDPAVFRAREQQVDAALAKELSAYERHWEALRAGEADWLNGAREAIQNYSDDVANTAKATEMLVGTALKGAEDAWVRFVTTGKLSFRELINSVIADLARLAAQRMFASLLGSIGFGGTSWGGGHAPIGGTMVAASGAAFSHGGAQAFAKGGAFTNTIISRPTSFAFAKGVGLMGEAGPEAIMPLKRTQGGQLGVVATGVGPVRLTVNNYGTNKTFEVERLSAGEVRIIARDEVARGAPNVIADQLDNPNSLVSKSMSRNTTAARQRY